MCLPQNLNIIQPHNIMSYRLSRIFIVMANETVGNLKVRNICLGFWKYNAEFELITAIGAPYTNIV